MTRNPAAATESRETPSRSAPDTASWRRLLALAESHPGGVTVSRDQDGVWWYVSVSTEAGVRRGQAQEIADALHVVADNLGVPA